MFNYTNNTQSVNGAHYKNKKRLYLYKYIYKWKEQIFITNQNEIVKHHLHLRPHVVSNYSVQNSNISALNYTKNCKHCVNYVSSYQHIIYSLT